MASATRGGALERLSAAVRRGLGTGSGGGTTTAQAQQAAERLDELGIFGVHYASPDEQLEAWLDALWDDQTPLCEPVFRETRLHLHYCAGEQHLAWSRERKAYLQRPSLPWRIRSTYNITAKAVNLRVARLTENKPAVSAQARKPDRDAIDKAELREQLFWHLWDSLFLHLKIVCARRWATKAGSGFLKVSWNPDAGPEIPVTRKVPRYEQVVNPATGQPEQVFAGVDEFYLDAKGEVIGPTSQLEEDPAQPGAMKRTPLPVPEECDSYHEGEADVCHRDPNSIRFDRYVDDVADSWYVQDREILPMSKIAAMFPDKVDALREARQATEADKALQHQGLVHRDGVAGVGTGGYQSAGWEKAPKATGERFAAVDREYVVEETWIYPRNSFLQKQWGKRGRLLIRVGGRLVHNSPLPRWAVRRPNFIQFIDTIEEGNHYHKPFLRDVIPLQDDVNRSRSHLAEQTAMRSRLTLTAPQNHGIDARVMSGMPAVLLTYRSPAHVPTALSYGPADPGAAEFYRASLEAASDVANMNEASTGKLPSAGLAAKAVYALQYADERSVSEASTLQDLALKRLAEAIDAVAQVEYSEARKIRVAGADRSFIVQAEITPEALEADVDWTFTPGSMMSRQKEAVKNEMLELRREGLVTDAAVKKNIATATPDIFRTDYDLQEAKARRVLDGILKGTIEHPQPEPWDDPMVHAGVLEEFLLTAKAAFIPPPTKEAIAGLWQAHKLVIQQMQAAQAAAAAGPQQPGQPGAKGGKPGAPKPGGEDPGGAPTPPAPEGAEPPAQGAADLAQRAESEVAPPAGWPPGA